MSNNPLLTCLPSCTTVEINTYILTLNTCPTAQEYALCKIIAHTNVDEYYSEWSCDSNGFPMTDPCDINSKGWGMLNCQDGQIVQISNFSGFSGNSYMFFIYFDLVN